MSISCWAAEDPQKLLQEACTLVSQQRNSLSDAIAVSEARSKIATEAAAKRNAEWEAYFKAYVGQPAADPKP